MPREKVRVNATVGGAGGPFRGEATTISDFRFQIETTRVAEILQSEICNLKSEISSPV
jgi:hypothetical protein